MSAGAKRNAILISVVVVVGGVAAYRFIAAPGSKPDYPKQYTVQGVCLACKQESEATQGVTERPPLECSKCRQRALFYWFYCPDCKKQFVPELQRRTDGPAGLPVVITCPGCRSARGEQYEPKDPDQKPVGKLPLPKWP